METIFITVHELGPDARIRYCSDSVEDILGYLPHEVKGKSAWEFFHPKEVSFARSIHGRGIELDKAAVLNYCRLRHRDGTWLGCECVFTIVYDVMVASTSIYKISHQARQRAKDTMGVRRVFSSSPRDPRYHMLSYLSNKFYQEPQPHAHEPRAALFLNRFTRTSTIMFATNGVANILGIQPDKLIGQSFYFCIAENCLREAVKCLESAKANDSIAYLRFWYRDPLQPEPSEQVDGLVSGEESDEDEDGGVSIGTERSTSVDMQDTTTNQVRNSHFPRAEVQGELDSLIDGVDGHDETHSHGLKQPHNRLNRRLNGDVDGQANGNAKNRSYDRHSQYQDGGIDGGTNSNSSRHADGCDDGQIYEHVGRPIDNLSNGYSNGQLDGPVNGYANNQSTQHAKRHPNPYANGTSPDRDATYVNGDTDAGLDNLTDGKFADRLDREVDGELASHMSRVPRFEAEEPLGRTGDLFSRLMPESNDRMHHSTSRSESETAPNTRSSSGNSTDLDANATDAIFDPPMLQRSNSSQTPQEEAPPIEIEAVVSCTSDGLVVVLRRARPLVPHVVESATDTPYFANGLFASPWAMEPIMPKDVPQATVQPTISYPPMNNPTESGFMAAIRDVAVFAWSLTGINGSLAQYSHGDASGEAMPPGGFPIWDPNSDADPENKYNGYLGSLHRPFEGMDEPSVTRKEDDPSSSDEEILWKRVPTMPVWRRPKRRGHHDAFGEDGDVAVDGEGIDGGRKKPSTTPL